MHPALLLSDFEPVVSAVEVADDDPLVTLAENLLGDCRSSAAVDPVVGQLLRHESPEPVVDPGDLPAGLIDVGGGRSSNGFEKLLGLDVQPAGYPLQRLGESSFRDRQPTHLLKADPDLIEGQPVNVLQKDDLSQNLRSQVAVGDLLGGIRSRQDALTPAAIVPMSLETGHFHPGRDQILLEVFRHFDGGPQPGAALRAVGQGLFHDPVNLRRGCPGDSRMPRLLTRGLGASGQRQKRKTGLLRRMEALNQTLDFLLQSGVLALEFVNEGNEVLLGQIVRIGDDGQNNLPL